MQQPIGGAPGVASGRDWPDVAWSIVLAAAGAAESMARADQLVTLALADAAQLRPVPASHPDAAIAWRPDVGWEMLLPPDDPRAALIDLGSGVTWNKRWKK